MSSLYNEVPKIFLDQFIVLVGLMGAGKTNIGMRMASLIGLPFVDTDLEVEKAAGCTISEIFKTFGEKQFREGERRVISRLLNERPAVIASGGGSFMDVRTRSLIKNKGISIWLRADLDLLYRRTIGRSHRPLLNNGNPREILRRLMEERHIIYEEADIIFDVTDIPPDKTAKLLIKSLINYGNGNRKVVPKI